MALSVLTSDAGWPGWWGQVDRADGVLMHAVYLLLTLAAWQWLQHDALWQRQLAWALLLGGGLTALSNILQQLHIVGVPNQNAFTGVSATPFGGTLGNRGYMGGYMALILPPVLWLWQDLPASRRRWGAAAVIVIAWALLGSFTRGAWLAGLIGCCWYAFYARPHWKSWWPLLVAFILFGITTVHFNNNRSFALSPQSKQGGKEQPADNAQTIGDNSGRTVLWKSALLGIKQKPVFGWGTPALLQVMNSRPDRQLLAENGTKDIQKAVKVNAGTKTMPLFRVTHSTGKTEQVALGGGVDKVHNEYLDYALTYGIPAALMFLALLGTAIWQGRLAVPGLSAGLVAYAIYLFTWPEVIRFAPIAWFFMGIALAAGRQKQQKAA